MAPKADRNLYTSDFNTVYSPFNNLLFMIGEEGPFQGMTEETMTLQSNMPKLTVPDSMNLTGEGTQTLKDYAKKSEGRLDQYMAENPDRLKDTPHAHSLQDELFRSMKQDYQYIQNGISTQHDKEYQGTGYFAAHGYSPNMKFEAFQPGNVEMTEKALEQYPLDKYMRVANDVQDAHMEYELGKNERSEAQNARLREGMREKKQALLDISKDLYEKSQNPTKETLALFGKEVYLTGANGFQSQRGLGTVMNRLEQDLTMSTTKEMEGLQDSLTKFNTSRAAVFKKESDEHKAMREATEKVQENLKKLKDSKLSAEERNRLKKETMDAIGKMDGMTDQYIKHASPNGKEPSTSAGKERLAGARELKEFAKSMKERFAADPDVQIEMKKEQEAKFRESLSGGAQKFYDSKMKNFQQFDGMSRNMFQDASPYAQSLGVNNFELMAAEMIAMSAVKEGIKNGSIEADRIRIEHERAVKNIIRDENFGKWRENIDKGVDAQRRVGPMTMDELRQDFVKGMSKEMQRTETLSQAKETEKTKEAENTKKAEKTTAKIKSKTNTKTNDKKEIKPVEKGGLKI